MVVGIGMLLSLIGLKSAGIVIANPDTMVSLGELRTVDVAIFAASQALMATLMHHKVWVGGGGAIMHDGDREEIWPVQSHKDVLYVQSHGCPVRYFYLCD